MALPLPSPEWQQSALQVPASASANDFIAAIEAAIDELTGDSAWTYSTPSGSDATHPARVLSPPASSPVFGDLCMVLGVAGGGEPAAAEELNGDAPAAGDVLGGVASGAYVSGNWHDASPNFGSGEWSKFAHFGIISGLTHVYVVASQESIYIGLRRSATSFQGSLFGCLIDPSDLGSAETNERVYGLMASGDQNNPILSPLTTTSAWQITRDSGNSTEGNFVIFNPVAAGTLRCNCEKADTVVSGSGVGSSTTLSGRPFFRAMYVRNKAAPYLRIGRLRGVFGYEDALNRAILTDSGASERGYVLSGKDAATDPAIVFGNAS